ncbi:MULTISPECIES: hypothetical protein [Thalassospira]|jgi:hypothetical protein|uniref:Uncharacterized protein n=1 Tax=Thalassospira xiamenensis TaxID=220697 RepID=A0ABR5Y483_9PROT|nr:MULTISPECIES: hypothetical protein [Thalassospira]MAL30967.1 hypothetical protein [Thalassospira sp.]MBR9779381.1 hypothetical protein [Rhodospirillales bacterium]KZD05162.1 hypothetical protein AUP40_14165 [Thalassospira xiamenensis]KZD11858.1 hypothetical protein AUP45_01670 [Thalassospira xiamenensis]MBL4843188.1 hypothetical protein [Thalassospira sp.]|tara:strand:+ start:7028 stop:7273 length:246 start_codon:yes stop_codon:yes gene_type:complete
MFPALSGLTGMMGGGGGGGSWLETSSEATAMSNARATSGQIYSYNTAPFIVGGDDDNAVSMIKMAVPFVAAGVMAWLVLKR